MYRSLLVLAALLLGLIVVLSLQSRPVNVGIALGCLMLAARCYLKKRAFGSANHDEVLRVAAKLLA